MRPTHIGIDAQGVFCVEAPEKPDDKPYRKTDDLDGFLKADIEYHEALKQAMKNKVYLKDGNYLIYQYGFIEGELYPIPEGFDVKINHDCKRQKHENVVCHEKCYYTNGGLKTCDLYAVLVPKQNGIEMNHAVVDEGIGAGDDYPVIPKGYEENVKGLDQLKATIEKRLDELKQPTSIEEAIGKAWEKDARGRNEPCNPLAFRYGFIAGAKYQESNREFVFKLLNDFLTCYTDDGSSKKEAIENYLNSNPIFKQENK